MDNLMTMLYGIANGADSREKQLKAGKVLTDKIRCLYSR